MANGINEVLLKGNVGGEVKITELSDGILARFTLATSEYAGAGKENHTEWHNISVFGRVAEVVRDYVAKGNPLLIRGKIRNTKKTLDDGSTKYYHSVVAREVHLLGGKPTTAAPAKPDEDPFCGGSDDVPF